MTSPPVPPIVWPEHLLDIQEAPWSQPVLAADGRLIQTGIDLNAWMPMTPNAHLISMWRASDEVLDAMHLALRVGRRLLIILHRPHLRVAQSLAGTTVPTRPAELRRNLQMREWVTKAHRTLFFDGTSYLVIKDYRLTVKDKPNEG